MFYCETCRSQNEWPEAFSTSHGKCECCGVTALCYDRPSSSLPPVKSKAIQVERPQSDSTKPKNGAISKVEKLVDHYGRCCAQQASWSTGGSSPSASARAECDERAAKKALMDELSIVLVTQQPGDVTRGSYS